MGKQSDHLKLDEYFKIVDCLGRSDLGTWTIFLFRKIKSSHSLVKKKKILWFNEEDLKI